VPEVVEVAPSARLALFDGVAMRTWIDRAHDVLSAARGALDELNVFPVADSDTGTNLLLTIAEGRGALDDVLPDAPLGDVAQAVADGALVGARGNSGIILSQYLRALAETFADQAEVDGAQLAWALDRGALSATAAMAHPVEGTALTVVTAAADAARSAAYLAREGDVTPADGIASAAVDAARSALARTPGMLAPLAERGVVDAGGAGFVLLLRALADVLAGVASAAPLDLPAPAAGPGAAGRGGCAAPDHGAHHEPAEWEVGDYEVMYVLRASHQEAELLQTRLDRIGGSVGVVGGLSPGRSTGLWHVHVHTDDPVAAVDAARGAALRQVCVRYLRGTVRPAGDALGVVACTVAPGLLAPLAGTGAVVVLVDPAEPAGVQAGIARAIVDCGRPDVVVLPCGTISAEAARAAADALAARGGGPRVEVLGPLGEAAVVAAVAAIGEVTDPRDPGASVRAAAERTRTAAVAWPGPFADLAEVAAAQVRTLLRRGDELLTVVAARGVPRAVLDRLGVAARAAVPEVELVELDGGQASPALALGAE
jgi:dihydroxyacetone kinase-like predicted kinase